MVTCCSSISVQQRAAEALRQPSVGVEAAGEKPSALLINNQSHTVCVCVCTHEGPSCHRCRLTGCHNDFVYLRIK